MKNVITKSLTVLCLGGICFNSRAEGELGSEQLGGVYGANRRVQTESGLNGANYWGARGHVTIDRFGVPGYRTAYNSPNGGNRLTDYYSIANSKPSIYLGCTRPDNVADGFVEVDAGIQYVWYQYPQYDPQKKIIGRLPRGWEAYMLPKSQVGGNRPQVNPASNWRSTANRFALEYGLQRAQVGGVGLPYYRGYLKVTELSAFGIPTGHDPEVIYSHDDGQALCGSTEGLAAKRVVAINQSRDGSDETGVVDQYGQNYVFHLQYGRNSDGNLVYREDGSHFYCTFTGGEVASGIPQAYPGNYQGWQPWSTATIDQTATGWYPEALDMTETDFLGNSTGLHGGSASKIVDFPAASLPPGSSFPNNGLAARDTETNPERYDNETVNIRLFFPVSSLFDPVQ